MTHRIGRQRGWLGTVGVLLALLIIAWLLRDALREYGLSPGVDKAGEAAEAAGTAGPTGLQRSPTPAAVATPSPGGAMPSYQVPLERARGVESTVNRAAEAQGRRIDSSTR